MESNKSTEENFLWHLKYFERDLTEVPFHTPILFDAQHFCDVFYSKFHDTFMSLRLTLTSTSRDGSKEDPT